METTTSILMSFPMLVLLDTGQGSKGNDQLVVVLVEPSSNGSEAEDSGNLNADEDQLASAFDDPFSSLFIMFFLA
ncbi:unnamed protein product [Linum trigynum]|uniref:Uncharacterized protein n=1 Tax=Linum trigynum TaxID=586398 RepID=A0AAV2CJN2_9ROSI